MAEFVVMPGRQSRIKRIRHTFGHAEWRYREYSPYLACNIGREEKRIFETEKVEATQTMEGRMKPIDPRIAAGLTGAIDPDLFIEEEIIYQRPVPLKGEDPAKRHKAAIKIIDQTIRGTIDFRS